jgi:hypothetical protein
MKKKELTKMLEEALTELILEFGLPDQPKRKSHFLKYKKSKYHPDEVERRKHQGTFQLALPNNGEGPEVALAPNVRLFLNTALESLPKNVIATKILQGQQVDKKSAMGLARVLMTIPAFPFQQPRKLMNLLILLSVANRDN